MELENTENENTREESDNMNRNCVCVIWKAALPTNDHEGCC